MPSRLIILILESFIVYFLVLGAHSLRHRYGPAHFYALMGSITAIMSWVTDAGLAVDVAGIRFVVGSTVFYTSLLLGIFVLYVFDGPRATRIGISTVAGVSAMMPLIAATLHYHMSLGTRAAPIAVPRPSLRINTASVAATLLDLVFLGIAWEFLGKSGLKIRLWFRTWLTLLGVMWLDVFIFATAAFAGSADYLRIMQGTLVSRFVISLFALPFLYGYLHWQSNRPDVTLRNRPVLAIFSQVAEMKAELSLAEREIERRRRAEAALRESKALLDATGELASVGGWRVDLPSREIRWTEQTRRILEVPPDQELSLEEGVALFHPADRRALTTSLRRAIDEGRPYALELRFITARGRHRWVHTVCRPHVVDGETTYLVGALQDISERKAMERQLHQRERMAAVGQMASGIAHDFRNRVNAILLYAEMALAQHRSPAHVTRSLKTIISESRGIGELVQQILDFSSQSMIDLQPIDLADVIEEAIDDVRSQPPDGVQIIVEREAGDFIVEADRERMRQALDNLASNALDAMPDGGTLTVALSHVEVAPDGPAPGLNERSWLPIDLPAGQWICLSVSDTGTGMTEEVEQHLFEPFFTTKEIDRGTGLGLPQVYGIVRQHGGIIDVETELGEGTSVRIYLPVHGSEHEDPMPDASEPERTRTVLLVEQNDSLRDAERQLLEALGYRVLTARNGRQALAMSRSPRWAGAQSSPIDLLIATLGTRATNGGELVRSLRKENPNLKAIAITGQPLDEESLASLEEEGFVETLTKPLELDALEQVLDRLFGGP